MSEENSNTSNSEVTPTEDSPTKGQATKPSSQKKGKKTKAKRSSKKKAGGTIVKRSKPTARPFPADTLEEALRIPTAIKNINAGNPWPPSEVAKALHMGAKANSFWYLSASSRDYGLTTGTSRTDSIALDTIGRDLLYAPSPEAERNALRRAFFNVEVFKLVYEYYKGGSLPDLKYLQNTLESVFNVPSQYH